MKELTYDHYLAWAKKHQGKVKLHNPGLGGAGDIWPMWDGLWQGHPQDDQLLENYEAWLAGSNTISYLLPEYFASLDPDEVAIIKKFGEDYL